MSNDWKINEQGIQYLRSIKDSGKKKCVNHPLAFETQKHGLTITTYISLEKSHAVMLIDGALWDECNFDLKCPDGMKVENFAEQIHITSVRNLFKDNGIKKIIQRFPKLKEFIEPKGILIQ